MDTDPHPARRSFLALGLAIAAGSAATIALGAEPEPAPDPKVRSSPPSSPAWLVVYGPGPAWLAGRPITEQPLREHGAYMFELYRRGVLQLAGPFADDSGGAVLFRAASEAEARAVVAADPAVRSEVFQYDLRPWSLVHWDQVLDAKG